MTDPRADQDHPDLDGKVFVMESSSASSVDPSAPSRFLYREGDGIVWGDYHGDTVRHGHFVGTRVGRSLSVRYVHVLAGSGEVVAGEGRSTIEMAEGGRIRLVERFQVGEEDHVSVCVEEVVPVR